jgi:hypothetical protein
MLTSIAAANLPAPSKQISQRHILFTASMDVDGPVAHDPTPCGGAAITSTKFIGYVDFANSVPLTLELPWVSINSIKFIMVCKLYCVDSQIIATLGTRASLAWFSLRSQAGSIRYTRSDSDQVVLLWLGDNHFC